MIYRLILPMLLALLFISPVCFSQAEEEPAPANDVALTPVGILADNFNAATLDAELWTPTHQHDFSELQIGVVSETAGEGRLRLRAATMETDDSTVKALGIVSRAPLDLRGEKQVSVELDWNDQFNGSYLTAAIYLCPTFTTGNPADEPQWLKLEVVGVPPGKHARAAVWLRTQQYPQWLYNEGWPTEQRTGRKIGKVTFDIICRDGIWQIMEDGKLLFDGKATPLPFDQAYLYLQMTSHSNYRARELYFDNVSFGPLQDPQPAD